MQEIIVDTARGHTLSPEAQKINELVREVRVLRECMEVLTRAFRYGHSYQAVARNLETLLEKKNDRN